MLQKTNNDPPAASDIEDFQQNIKHLSVSMIHRCLREVTLATVADKIALAALCNAFSTFGEAQKLVGMQNDEFLRHILTRATEEPKHGICDVVAYRPALIDVGPGRRTFDVRVPSSSIMIRSAKPTAIRQPQLPDSLIQMLRAHMISDSVVNSRNELGSVRDYYNGFDTELGGRVINPGDRKNYQDVLEQPLDSSISEWRPPLMPPVSVRKSVVHHNRPTDLILRWPVILAEFKKTESTDKALHQLYTYMVSAIDMYASLGLKDHPVWGVFTNGAEGGILLGWRSSKTDVRCRLFPPCANYLDKWPCSELT